MVTIKLQTVFFSILCLFVCVERRVDAIPKPPDLARGWYIPFRLPEFNFGNIWRDITQQTSNFIDKYVMQPIKSILNYDPTPDWVPEPKEFEVGSQLSASEVEEHADDRRSYEERGNLHWFGRDVLRTITHQFSSITKGLDTDKHFFTGFIGEFKDKVKAIYPGTQWCGDGNIARSSKDLGFFRKTDRCCREHDSCPEFIPKDGTKYGLYNTGLFSRLHCDCDKRFYNCLKEAHDVISMQVGTAYFSVLGPQCFKKTFPIIGCKIKYGFTHRCLEYEYDYSGNQSYQWFDNPEF